MVSPFFVGSSPRQNRTARVRKVRPASRGGEVESVDTVHVAPYSFPISLSSACSFSCIPSQVAYDLRTPDPRPLRLPLLSCRGRDIVLLDESWYSFPAYFVVCVYRNSYVSAFMFRGLPSLLYRGFRSLVSVSRRLMIAYRFQLSLQPNRYRFIDSCRFIIIRTLGIS